ncbi:methyl-accepting chemotaxis protein [Pararobbsia silviterrae]|uniref:HAMP domain-containing protein n=1 Tax=Pararobbsia silviterrae TaxID=1792498 RepID=A0A494Y1J7_9BURK|nr:methyl-accepting chemotaxis protein [Pararobbsia silviterrae]RKP56642.1 HAMP domain-containing protein [Pararobbsia silviterrae]
MLKNITIRGGLTLVIGIFVAFLVVVIGVGFAGLKLANTGLHQVQHNSSALSSLKTSSEKLLKVRLALGTYETLFSVGKQTDDLLPAAHKVLVESNNDFAQYMNTPFSSPDEQALADTVAKARKTLVDDAIEVEFKALNDNDFTTFRNIQGQTANDLYAKYATAISALEDYQVSNEQKEADVAGKRFTIASSLFLAIGAITILVALIARVMLSAALVKPVQHTMAHFDRMAAGDLSVDIRGGGRNEMGQLLISLQKMREGLITTVSQVRASTDAIHLGTNEIASGNIDLSRRTEQQAAALEETAASMEELSATVKQNADNAKQASRLAHNASDTVTRGGNVVGRVIETMNGISEASRKVAEIIGVIEGIAFQTNILALNAAVEAARAGEQGRGFAVVASEVRSLAQRSGTAAKEIKDLIGASVARVEQGSALVSEAGSTMKEAMTSVGRVTDIMGEIEAAAREQSDGIEQVNKAITQIDEVTQHNAALVEEAAASAKSLEEQAAILREAVAVFRVRASDRDGLASSGGSSGAAAREGGFAKRELSPA